MNEHLKRENNSGELKKWLDQINFFSKINKNFSDEISRTLEPIVDKYKNFN